MLPFFTPKEPLSEPLFNWRRFICAVFIKPLEEDPDFANMMSSLLTDRSMIHRVMALHPDVEDGHTSSTTPSIAIARNMMVSDMLLVERITFNVKPDSRPELAMLCRTHHGDLAGIPESDFVRYFGGRLPDKGMVSFGDIIHRMTNMRMIDFADRRFDTDRLPLPGEIGNMIMDREDRGFHLYAEETTRLLIEAAKRLGMTYLNKGRLIEPGISPALPDIDLPELVETTDSPPEERYREERKHNPEFGVLDF